MTKNENARKPSEACKAAGLKSLAELSEISTESVQTLNNWYKNEPRRFELILKGALFEKTVAAMTAATTPRSMCEHDWKLHQIAGEGRICKKCQARDFEYND